MKVVALISGGKDSTFNALKCVAYGHEIVCLANLKPENDIDDELDSWMYQTVGHHGIDALAEAWGLPLIRATTKGKSSRQSLDYDQTDGDEVEDLLNLLTECTRAFPEIEAVASGALFSTYQRNRVENVCGRLGLKSLAYLWQKEQKQLIQEMIDVNLEAVIVKVAAEGLNEDHLGKTIKELQPYFHKLENEIQMNVAGEGGEYESFTLDCPHWSKKLILDEVKAVKPSNDTAHLHFENILLEEKPQDQVWSSEEVSKALRRYPELEEEPQGLELDDRVRPKGVPPQNPEPCTSVHKSGNFVFVSGLPVTNSEPGSVEENVNAVLNTMEENLKSAEAEFSMGVYMQFYLNDISEFLDANSVYKSKFGINPPSRCCVELPLPAGQSILADCLAYKGTRHVLHVQSFSEWAPCCIGPYSQCNLILGLLFCAGQIALYPPTMQTIPNDQPNKHTCQTWWNVNQCLEVLNSHLSNCLTNIVYTKFQPANELFSMIRDRSNTYLEEFGESDEYELPSTDLLYVNVPKMPRNAMIEIIPFAYQKSLLRVVNCRRQKLKGERTRLTAIHLGQYVSSITIRYLGPDSIDDFGVGWNLLAAHMKQHGFSTESIIFVRAYYDIDLTEPKRVLDSLQSGFTQTFSDGGVPAMSLIPSCGVLGGDDDIGSVVALHVYILNEDLWKEHLAENNLYCSSQGIYF